jgi:predicted ATP-grasp superfamily ATP-dependent carboligase
MYSADAVAPQADSVLDDAALAAQFRSQADALYKEAKALRDQAEELVPTIKKKAKVSAKKTETSDG